MQTGIMNSTDGDQRLSFSDLQFSTDDLHMDSNVDEHQNHDFLGFFTEEWAAATSVSSINAQEDIVFCGKIIPISNPNPKNNYTSDYKSSIPRQNSDSFTRSSNGHFFSSNARSNSLPISGRRKDDGRYNNEVLAQKPKKLACSSKSRWRVFVFGSGKFPTKMELSDIRSRQLRRSRVGEEERSRGNRLSGMIRLLGCGGGFNDFVPFC